LLGVGRLIWRLSHTAPGHPANAPKWEHLAANATHIALYALLFLAPLTGWALVSVSSLNVDTLLFNVIPWPHIPGLHNWVNPESADARFAQFHEIATGALILLLLLHVGAALKHHFFNKDDVLTRISPTKEAGTVTTMFKVVAVLVLGIGSAVFAYAQMNSASNAFTAGNSAVKAVISVLGTPTDVNFAESSVTASINTSSPEKSTLQASVTTASAASGNKQVESSLPDAEWFDSENHPTATFTSQSMTLASAGVYSVTGTLTIKDISDTHTFDMTISDVEGVRTATGEFVVDRTVYELGLLSQPNEDNVANAVTITFEFALNE